MCLQNELVFSDIIKLSLEGALPECLEVVEQPSVGKFTPRTPCLLTPMAQASLVLPRFCPHCTFWVTMVKGKKHEGSKNEFILLSLLFQVKEESQAHTETTLKSGT